MCWVADRQGPCGCFTAGILLYLPGSYALISPCGFWILSADFRTPIYVGKAIPTGGRKGGPDGGLSTGTELYRRLQDHAKSVEQASNLRLEEFKCRYLVVVPVWITLAERFLIDHYRPVWNTVIDGFGNHPPGAGRKDMRRPRWDVVHPGRPWASKLTAAETPAEIIALI